MSHLRAVQDCVAQDHLAQIRAAQIRFGKVGIAQIRLPEASFGEESAIRLDVAEFEPVEGRAFYFVDLLIFS